MPVLITGAKSTSKRRYPPVSIYESKGPPPISYVQYHCRPVTLKCLVTPPGESLTYNKERLGKASKIKTTQGAKVHTVSSDLCSVNLFPLNLVTRKEIIIPKTAIPIKTIIKWAKSLKAIIWYFS